MVWFIGMEQMLEFLVSYSPDGFAQRNGRVFGLVLWSGNSSGVYGVVKPSWDLLSGMVAFVVWFIGMGQVLEFMASYSSCGICSAEW
ncbi:hypothetical protein KUV50_00535 [Membranicola marinus]|uniref:Uncharacterized protein n=1 Tax=Membranihabitans marinus TaxID=1227546 RepID=A0A953HKA6_9BACT|nr:hypothetical protein [Membranihabitans marinus]MBY5956599.1 hypothetical protein [Membranihabitans marinus]